MTAELRGAGGRLENMARELGMSLQWWAARDTAEDQAAARQAASRAVGVVDQMLSELHRSRERLVSEARQWDDATADRVDAMLARRPDDP
jgi:hypothetical protein